MSLTQKEMDARLHKNGWDWFLISTVTPGVVRLQMGSDGEIETLWRKCFEAPTIEQAVSEAEQFISTISAEEYGKTQDYDWGEAIEHTLAADVCPRCGGSGVEPGQLDLSETCVACDGRGHAAKA
jgi:hypothetical protein